MYIYVCKCTNMKNLAIKRMILFRVELLAIVKSIDKIAMDASSNIHHYFNNIFHNLKF